MIKRIEEIEGVKFCNGTTETLCQVEGIQSIQGTIALDEEFKNLKKMVATNDSKTNEDFISGKVKLIEGRPLTSKEQGAVLLSREIAELNRVNVDDKIIILLWICIGISIVILTLVLTMWNRERIHETGVYLALGIKKRQIILQYLLEVLLIGSVAFSIAYLPSKAVAEKFIEYTVTNEKVDEAPEEGLYLENLNDGTSDYVDSEFTESEAQIKIGVVEIVKLFLIGLSLIGISISFSTLYILRMRPREILSKMC